MVEKFNKKEVSWRLEIARQVLQVGHCRRQSLMGETPKTALAPQRTGLAIQTKPASAGYETLDFLLAAVGLSPPQLTSGKFCGEV
ncbi:hypothetical protein [Nostoc sp.]|uniref:hypothetical protein n=1 Tax=Nostoc sp. TaxID=1180 RepID=UPI002FF52CC0